MAWFTRRSKAVDQFAVKNATFLYGIGAARWLERRFDLLAKDGYEQNPIVYACVTKLARASASVDLHVYRKQGGKLVKLENHPLLKLLERPNPMAGGRSFREAMATYRLIGGNAYVHGEGIDPFSRKGNPPKELWLLPTQSVTVQAQPQSALPAWYDYRPGQAKPIRFPVDRITGKCAILHLKTVNPLNPSIGLPPLVAAAFGVDTFNSGQAWNKALLDNEARPSGALEIVDREGKPVSLTDDQRSSLKRMLDDRFSGKHNAGKPMVLEGGMKWTPISLSPKDMDHRETMLVTARFIAGVFHTPPQLVNIPGESTYSNYGEAKVAYYSDTVIPFLESDLEELNNWLAPLFGDDLVIWYDEEAIPALEPRRKEKGDRINAATYMTVNEKRRAMGLDDVDGGDVVLVPSTNIPLELAGEIPDLAEPGSDADGEEDAPSPEPEPEPKPKKPKKPKPAEEEEDEDDA
ncbi:phage portal protein [Tautonia plasticadhaerens]|uniref:Phage portal protein n=1 Tax=Tautonia plasticadhaerens TaxID=2527974 RepID=A0A518H249_9BACT|nr:phage portal protein [Tautonia plasticadhaerens]QDV34921.1 Phage portal protein [Tautonia plasticadhaerens]